MPKWVVVSLRDGDRARHLRRRLADHQDARHQGRRGPPAAGLRLRDRRRVGHPRVLARRLPALDHPGRLGRRRRLGRRPPGRGRQLAAWPATSSSAGCLTLPAAAAVAALVYGVIDVLGGGEAGMIVVSAAMVVAAFLLWRANRAQADRPGGGRVREPGLRRDRPSRRWWPHDPRRRRLGQAARRRPTCRPRSASA